MRVCGIIAEYNPFHSGHAYQIARAREITGCERVIIAMSGAFTQRGEPAIIDKWTRAQAALANGADIVFELPCLFALREARGFAQGGVHLLSSLGIVDALSFGCEPAGIPYIEPVARCLADEPEGYRALLRTHLDAGQSYPRARSEAAAEYMGIPAESLSTPNFALALEYAQAAARLDSKMQLVPVTRTSEYHGLALGEVCSASAIRAAVAGGDIAGALAGVPENCRAALENALASRAGTELLDDLVLFTLRSMTPGELRAYAGAGEGLENLIIKKAAVCANAEELIAAVKSKRYTYARIKRLLTQIVLGITREMQQATPLPTYARVLACRRDALPLLGEIKRAGTLPLVTDVTKLERTDPLWRLETRATDLWGLCTDDPVFRRAGRDYTRKFAIVD